MADSGSHAHRDWLRVALDKIGDAVVTTDAQDHVTFMNPAAERLTGVGLDFACGRPLQTILSALDESQVEKTVEPLVDEAGASAGAVLVLRDVAELRRHAEELVTADRRKDQFLAMLAHELRNPLAPIRNAVELMRQVETVDPSFQPAREMVERQVKHLARLVDDLLDISRITHGSIRLRKEIVALDTVLQRAVEGIRPLIASRGHELTVEPPREPVRLEADPTRLEQVISNLLDNAAKWSPPGEEVEIEVRGDRVTVRDHGPGIADEDLPYVFDRFYRARSARGMPGSGLGLAIVRQVAEAHGGDVVAERAEGGGTRIVLRLGRAPVAAGIAPVERS